MLTIIILSLFFDVITFRASLPDCNAIVQAKLSRNPQAWIWHQPGHITEMRDNVPYGTDCKE